MVFLPAEDILLWILRIEKPVPTTGDRLHQRGRGRRKTVRDANDDSEN
jgi:hypothetical protein